MRDEEGKLLIPTVADKLTFFKVTKCDRMMKPLGSSNQGRSEEPSAKQAFIELRCSRY
jgi:hypothetical protein